ncbi:MAG: hypothetical protein U5N55_14145 [Cypionkella sp.]|nr:hypothetical protein [Cypionkella sp.]
MRVFLFVLLWGFVGLGDVGPARAQTFGEASEAGFWGQTSLRGLSLDGLNAQKVRQAARGSYELSGGGAVKLAKWYSPDFPNLSASFETNIGHGVSVIWGGSLGESGAKYRLGPSAVVGFALRRPAGRNATFNLEVIGHVGGDLFEDLCVADYGSLGGVQPVNCRLAATALPPKKTLEYRWDDSVTALATIQLSYQLRF